MNYVLKSIFVSLIFTMVLKVSSGQNQNITLTVAHGKLILSDNGTTNVKKDKNSYKIHWQAISPGIGSFYIVPKNIFNETLSTNAKSDLSLSTNPATFSDWSYSIIWFDDHGKQQTPYDPKIAVMATPGPLNLIKLLWGIIASIMSVIFFAKWRNAKAALVKNNQQNNI